MPCNYATVLKTALALFLASSATFTTAALATAPAVIPELCVTYAYDKKTGQQVCVNAIEPGNLPTDGRFEAIVLPPEIAQSKLVWANEIHSGPITQRTHEYLKPGETLAKWTTMLTTQYTFGQGVNTLSGMREHLSQSAQANQARFTVLNDSTDWLLVKTYNPKLNVEFFYSATQAPEGLYAMLYESKIGLSDAERKKIMRTYFSQKPQLRAKAGAQAL